MLPGARLTAFTLQPDDLRDMSRGLEARLEFEADDVLIADAGVALPPPPWFGTSVGLVNFALGRTGLAKRRFPLVTEYASGVRERFELDVSAALAAPISLPETAPIETPTLAWRQSVAHDAAAGRLTGEAEFRLETVEFSPAEYLELKSRLDEIAYARRKRPIFRRADRAAADPAAEPAPTPAHEAEADIEVLEHTTEYAVASASDWTVTETVRKRVLTFAGIKAHSEIKIPYNTGWESVELAFRPRHPSFGRDARDRRPGDQSDGCRMGGRRAALPGRPDTGGESAGRRDRQHDRIPRGPAAKRPPVLPRGRNAGRPRAPHGAHGAHPDAAGPAAAPA